MKFLESTNAAMTRLLGRKASPPAQPAAQLSAALAEGARRDADARKTVALAEAVKTLTSELALTHARENAWRADAVERAHELVEARQMAGAGPWLVAEARTSVDQPRGALRVQEAITSQGGFGDLELMLQNAEWRREVNWSWLEFSRWGIQQIILISRLYYIKNPIIRRLIDVDAAYVMGRYVEISSPDPDANDVLTAFVDANQTVLGQVALAENQKRTNYDGNLFFAFFADTDNAGTVSVRLIDASEMQDIVSDPEDACVPWYYRRAWTQRNFDAATGATSATTVQRWYPALNYAPDVRPAQINGIEVDWAHPVLHRAFGRVGQWTFGCPPIYPALDWAKAARKYLEAVATVQAALSQIAQTITTKGGQQALVAAQQQLGTTVGPNAPGYDMNPPAIAGSTFASGPGTVLTAFVTRGKGQDPAEVKEFKTMAAICMGVPPTFLGDLDTANLATATTLDRPTELGFMLKQEAWREILTQIATYVLSVSKGAANGKLRESLERRKIDPKTCVIREAAKIRREDGTSVYLTEAQRAKAPAPKNVIEVKASFPAILEGDLPALITATADAMTLGNKGGQVTGIDEKAGVYRLMELIDIEDRDELIEVMYPDAAKGDAPAYDAVRTRAVEPAPLAKAAPDPGGVPQAPGGDPTVPKQPGTAPPAKAANAKVAEALARVKAALALYGAA